MWKRDDGYIISTKKEMLDVDVIHRFLSEDSYWSKGMDYDLVEASIANSQLCYGVYTEHKTDSVTVRNQVGFARVVTDYVKFAWLADVFILPAHRGKGLSKWLLSCMLENPHLKGTRFGLATNDAHGLYAQFGFEHIQQPENRMERPLDWEVVKTAYSKSIGN
ncbi:GNAT family N-acetyltransferase [Fictibacillus aquaticus]|uniref:GNAT family N-acetyltransferase n=1 Tax=Fictibacillus aquaticus TaxID=2021314 RepID=A0A235FFK1_9BACL|nr:GNAT family N-acetyltransferase [Fictibacillus aquaticus]OYD59717.1 GNAT family N-acetyltransferase [Fictibacillus aquaticus]